MEGSCRQEGLLFGDPQNTLNLSHVNLLPIQTRAELGKEPSRRGILSQRLLICSFWICSPIWMFAGAEGAVDLREYIESRPRCSWIF